jgi:hypothetical protein
MPRKSKSKVQVEDNSEVIDINLIVSDSESDTPAANRGRRTAKSADPSPLPSLLSELSEVAVGTRKAHDIQQLFRIDEQEGYRYCKTCE